MTMDDGIRRRLDRLQKWSDRFSRIWEREVGKLDGEFQETVRAFETQARERLEALKNEEAEIRSGLDQAGKDFSHKKYQLERDGGAAREDAERLKAQLDDVRKKAEQEITRINEEKVTVQVSVERQKSALQELYDEKRRHLTVVRGSVLRDFKTSEEKLRKFREKSARELETLKTDHDKRLGQLRQQADAKKDGWTVALESMRKTLDALNAEKTHLERSLETVRAEKEKELVAAQTALSLGTEQLEIDKATLIERAEEEQRRCESEVHELKDQVDKAERELQDLILDGEKKRKDSEEAFQREEEALKESVKIESERRDYEQKLFEQEKLQKEQELQRLRESLEKRKWHWDNQIRTLVMQKSVQDSEAEAERLRVDREARVILRGMEAKRDDLRRRLNEIKGRHESFELNHRKEVDLMEQRRTWRKDRLWTMWQKRLEVLKKERLVLAEQIGTLQAAFAKEKAQTGEVERQEGKKLDDLQKFVLEMSESHKGQRRQREVQLELEKTRISAQIRECENLMADWSDRLKVAQEEGARQVAGFSEQLSFLDQWYREEEKETQLFITALEHAMSALQGALERVQAENAA